MWFVFLCGAFKLCVIKHNRNIWFMNRNPLSKQMIVWHIALDPGLTVASFTDDGTLAISELIENLSAQEKDQSARLIDPVEHRHFIARRSFQRLFVGEVLSTTVAPGKLDIIHQIDTRPYCSNEPDLNLSFSSSGTTAIACASTSHAVGIDIERLRNVENVIALAKRYFVPEEAENLQNLPTSQQSQAFLHYWTAKEAGLKVIGQGIVFGLNTFTLKEKGGFSYEIQRPGDNSCQWQLQHLEIIPQHLVALVKKISVGKV
jgi:4'-phosphopantetheinyl transferase